jgi:hypothetical protein
MITVWQGLRSALQDFHIRICIFGRRQAGSDGGTGLIEEWLACGKLALVMSLCWGLVVEHGTIKR